METIIFFLVLLCVFWLLYKSIYALGNIWKWNKDPNVYTVFSRLLMHANMYDSMWTMLWFMSEPILQTEQWKLKEGPWLVQLGRWALWSAPSLSLSFLICISHQPTSQRYWGWKTRRLIWNTKKLLKAVIYRCIQFIGYLFFSWLCSFHLCQSSVQRSNQVPRNRGKKHSYETPRDHCSWSFLWKEVEQMLYCWEPDSFNPWSKH